MRHSVSNTQFAVGLHVLTYLSAATGAASDPRPVGSDELAGSIGVTPVHVRRVLAPLREAGLVRSRPGARGGWTLGRPAAEIGLAQVWDAVVGDDPVFGLHRPVPDCPVGRQVQADLSDLSTSLSAQVRSHLELMTVADLGASRVEL